MLQLLPIPFLIRSTRKPNSMVPVTITLILMIVFSIHGVAQDSLNMTRIYQWEDTSLQRAPLIFNRYNDVWGYHDPATGNEYAIMGSTEGTHFFDLSDKSDIRYLGMVPGADDNMIHRDLKTKGHWLLAVSDEFNGTLQVMDLRDLPNLPRVVYDDGTFFQQSHNIYIDGDRMYACIPRRAWRPLVDVLGIYDISDPANPTILKTYADSTSSWGNIHDLYVKDNIGYLNAESRGMFVVDFTDPENPVTLAHLATYPFQGYNHSGWVSADGNTYVMADETHGLPMKLYDVSDLSNITLLSYLFPEMTFPITDTNAIAHNPIIHHNFVFASYYYDGVYIWDISDRENPVIAGFYDTFPEENDGFFNGNWGVYPLLPSGLILASDMKTGLHVLEFALSPASVDPDKGSDRITVSPNPASQQLRVETTQSPFQNPSLTLYDMSGRQVASKSYSGTYESLLWRWESTPSPGMYWLQVSTREGSFSKKISVQ